MIDQGIEVSRAVNKRLADEPHYRLKHATTPGLRASIFGIGTLARIECVEHEILDLMTFDRLAQRMVYAVAGLRFLGQGAYAETVLHDRKGTVTFSDPIDREIPARWLETLYAYLVGDAAIEDLEELAYTTQEPRRIMGEVYFHSAVASLAAGDRERAIDGFRRAYRAFDGAMGYTYQGKLFLRKVRNDPSWPPWIPSESDSADPSGDEVARTLTGTVPRGGD